MHVGDLTSTIGFMIKLTYQTHVRFCIAASTPGQSPFSRELPLTKNPLYKLPSCCGDNPVFIDVTCSRSEI